MGYVRIVLSFICGRGSRCRRGGLVGGGCAVCRGRIGCGLWSLRCLG